MNGLSKKEHQLCSNDSWGTYGIIVTNANAKIDSYIDMVHGDNWKFDKLLNS